MYGCHDIQMWHRILGHCNFYDIAKLQKVVEGMSIKGKHKSNQNCEICTEGKFTQSRNRQAVLELVNTDLCGPIEPADKDGYRYAIAFTADYSGMIFPYFIKAKSDTTKATEKFIADVAPYGKIKCIRSDNGTEFTGQEFQFLLRSNGIRQETSAPYSPHQNGTAKRGWRTLFEMSRCMLLESNLSKQLWTYSVQTAAQIRNRCYSRVLEQTTYRVFTGKTPNLSDMKIFGSECYIYQQDKKKLDSRCKKGIFVGYDKYSPAYNVYYPEIGKGPTQTDSTQREQEERKYPMRQRKAPEYLKEYQCKAECNNDESKNVDYFYRVAYGVPKAFREAMDSKKSKM